MKLDKTLDAIKGVLDRHKEATTKLVSQMAAAIVELNDKIEAVAAANKAAEEQNAKHVAALAELDNKIKETIAGEKGGHGQEAPPVEIDVADVVKELLASDGIKQLVGLEVDAFLTENPPPPGKDGKDGDKGDPGEPGKSVTLDDVSLFLDAAIAKHVLELERRASETIARAIDKIPAPKDGRDGVDLTEVGLEFDGERTVTVKGRTGEVSKRLPIPLWRGYWSEGVVAERGDILTHNGTAYIAVVDNPKCEPGVGKYDHEWKVFARKGRDGKDGRNGVDRTKAVSISGYQPTRGSKGNPTPPGDE